MAYVQSYPMCFTNASDALDVPAIYIIIYIDFVLMDCLCVKIALGRALSTADGLCEAKPFSRPPPRKKP
jgi:hypothetical protein